MSEEAYVAMITAGCVIIALTAGYIVWNIKRLVTDVGQLKTDVAVIHSVIQNFPEDHDKIILMGKTVDDNTEDISNGFESMRKRLKEIQGAHTNEQ